MNGKEDELRAALRHADEAIGRSVARTMRFKMALQKIKLLGARRPDAEWTDVEREIFELVGDALRGE